MPFLFDTASMPDRQAACAHCPPDEAPGKALACCGVCAFGGPVGRCGDEYSAGMAQQFMGSGLQLRVSDGAFVPRICDTHIPPAGPAALDSTLPPSSAPH